MLNRNRKSVAKSEASSGAEEIHVHAEIKKTTPLNFLCLEDNPADREILVETLRAEGLSFDVTHAKTKQEFQAAIGSTRFDIIISDFALPAYNGLAALEAARSVQPETPFLFLSGTIGEERAVETLKSGATDYVLKGHMERLGPAIRRALGEAREREGRRRAEWSLKESEARFRQLAENIGEVFWLMDTRRNKVLYVNPAFEKVWGIPCESLYRNPRVRIETIHEEDRGRIIEAMTQSPVRADYDETYRIVQPDGAVRWIRERMYPVRNEAGEFDRLAGTAEDVTEQRSLQERYRQAQKMEAIGQLAGGVAHDFNNLLTVMRGNSELILMEPEGLSAMARESLRHVVDATHRAANLTRQLLTFSRKQVMQPRPLDLNGLVTELMKMLSRLIGEDIKLQCNYAVQPVGVHADAGMLEQVLMNLVVNARDAMPQGGWLAVTTSRVIFGENCERAHPEARVGDFACVEVTDSGTGIAPEHLPRIFEPFFTTKEMGKGTGLGLATVYGIAKQHLGWVEVSSRPNAGATFKVFLPAAASLPATVESPTHAALRRGSETILLVEDDPAVRLMTRRTLEAYGYRVWEADSGREALRIWRNCAAEINLLLSDLVMPDGITGSELARVLRDQRPDLRILLMSGYSPEMAGKDAGEIPLDLATFLQKPYRSAVLIDTVRRCLDTPAAAQTVSLPETEGTILAAHLAKGTHPDFRPNPRLRN
jgi:PAS domain S-box-containing protein